MFNILPTPRTVDVHFKFPSNVEKLPETKSTPTLTFTFSPLIENDPNLLIFPINPKFIFDIWETKVRQKFSPSRKKLFRSKNTINISLFRWLQQNQTHIISQHLAFQLLSIISSTHPYATCDAKLRKSRSFSRKTSCRYVIFLFSTSKVFSPSALREGRKNCQNRRRHENKKTLMFLFSFDVLKNLHALNYRRCGNFRGKTLRSFS